MENDTAVIREQMEQTRTALTEKVEAIEQKVTAAVKETTEAVSSTVQNVTDTVEGTVQSVSDSVETVKQALDISSYVEQYPWIAMGGSVALGYALGSLIPSGNGRSYPQAWGAPSAPSGVPESYASSAAPSQPSGGSFLPESLMPVVDKLKGLALGTAAGVLGEMLLNLVPDTMKEQMSRAIDETTVNLGGTVVRRDQFSSGGGFRG